MNVEHRNSNEHLDTMHEDMLQSWPLVWMMQ